MRRVDLAIVGAGPAGVAAAVTAARRGLRVALIDEAPTPGGQVLTNPGTSRPHDARGQAIERGQTLLAELGRLPVELYRETIAWALEGTCLALSGPESPSEIEAAALIIATGGREYVPPFPGWTLPGVMTLGGAQRLIDKHGVLPGRSILIAGAGPLMWALAASVLENDGEVLAILDASRPADWARALPLIGTLQDRLRLAWRYFKVMRGSRTPYLFARGVLQARGDGYLEAVLAGERTYTADSLCVGFGFRPNIELLQLAGCGFVFERWLGGWIPAIDEHMRTDQPAIYAAGECSGVGGAAKALLEGELAALAAGTGLGVRLEAHDEDRLEWLKRRRQREIRFARVLNHACRPPRAYTDDLVDETILCRCESVRYGQVEQALQHGATSLDGLKNELRVGQGMCQGRTCGPVLQQVLAQKAGQTREQILPFHVRPPVKPVELGKLQEAG
ncbi:MAG: FAD/NAD(P)-binding oxidoreductase [Anaerolineales bacterium]|nr:FAD/NAD(P)-binding oxidoreductase [Anaerolineales bacterium]